ncbi:MAG TPA: response regulator [Flavisolibacter sp.]|nr:response regulator [Flavisolibacter sp.]
MQNIKASINSILLIDDDYDDCFVFETILKEVSSTVKLTCLNTCETILQSLDGCQPDLIFLDINMPKIDGFTCLQKIQESATYCRIPIIMYSSSNSTKEVIKAYGYGATLFFSKPTNYIALKESLKNILIMDWNNPSVIKEQFFKNGKYTTYTP